ncbi:MAG TPA: TRAP transporter small permease [Clostridia bacterium]|nr:TRAP transporter small permease [Clostridia bacterium]
MSKFGKFYDGLMRFTLYLSSIGLFLLVVLVTANTIGRGFRHPIPGGYDLITLSAAVCGSLSIAYCTKLKGHVHVDIVVNVLSPRGKKIQKIICGIMGIALWCLIAWQSVKVFLTRLTTEVTEVLKIPYAPFRFLFVFSMILTVVILVEQLIEDMQGGKEA